MFQITSENLDDFIKILEDPLEDSDSKWEICTKLVKYKTSVKRKEIVDILEMCCFPPNCAIVRAHAVKALGELNAKESIGPLLKVLDDKHYLPRSYCVDTLKEILVNNNDIEMYYKDKIVSSIIEKAENDNYFGVRAASNNALKTLCDLGDSITFLKAKAILWDTKKREDQKKEAEEKKNRVVQEAYPTSYRTLFS